MKIVVLDGYAACYDDEGYKAFHALGENVTVYDRTPPEEVIECIGDAEMVLINKVRMTREVMDGCPKLRYIGVTATGYNIVDMQAAADHGITVTNVPAYSTQSVVQQVMALLLHSLSHIAVYDARVKRGDWVNSPDFCFFDKAPIVECCGMTMGIIGFGNIGQAVARAAWGMGMNVIISTPHPKEDKILPGMRFVTMDELFAQSDVVTLHCPLNDSTRGLIGEESIAKMKDGVRVINTARGPAVDGAAMAKALASGKVACYMADVMDSEPPKADDPLLRAPNTVFTPHIAWAPKQARERLMKVVADNIRAFECGKPQNVVK